MVPDKNCLLWLKGSWLPIRAARDTILNLSDLTGTAPTGNAIQMNPTHRFALLAAGSLLGTGLAMHGAAQADSSVVPSAPEISPQAELPMPPLTITATDQARSDSIHVILKRYGLKCGNPGCPICYPQNAAR